MTSSLLIAFKGPAGANETIDNWKAFGATFPNAIIVPSSLDTFYNLLDTPAVRQTLLVVTSEMGDTWIFGVAADPLKVKLESQCL